ncbi:MAG: hypothetical protein AAFY43_09370 [Pseudomonadota bacterium]
MSSETPLDLSAEDKPIWRIKVGDTVYGPYTLAQLATFAGEGRLAAHTLVSAGPDAPFEPAGTRPALEPVLSNRQQDPGPEPAPDEGRFVITVHLNGASSMAITAALNTVGRFGEIAPNVFVLRSQVRLAKVRERLAAIMGERDQAVIVDASTGRLAWINLGPETDVFVREIWSEKHD